MLATTFLWIILLWMKKLKITLLKLL